MPPPTPLPYPKDFFSADDYVDSLLEFSSSSHLFRTLCGGVHILDFFTASPSHCDAIVPEDWKLWLMDCPLMDLLDFLMRDDLQELAPVNSPPASLVRYVQEIRRHSLLRTCKPPKLKQTTLPRHVAVGMVPKKIHEVVHFADYVDRLSDDIAQKFNQPITHLVDFGSGQNYLGRALASPPYNKHIIAVESQELNINGARSMDVLAKIAEREVVMRNKKVYREQVDRNTPQEKLKDKAKRRIAKSKKVGAQDLARDVDLRPIKELAAVYNPVQGHGSIQYVEHVVKDGELSDVVSQIQEGSILIDELPSIGTALAVDGSQELLKKPGVNSPSSLLAGLSLPHRKEPRLMAISIHSCGNLSHHGIRSLLLNEAVQAIAIVGCCYNLLTERLGPPTYKLPNLRPNMQAINAPVPRESPPFDPHGYPMSERLAKHNEDGIRLNITARMMAVQAPQNWTEQESDHFFTRHFFRSLLQKIFLDKGIVRKPNATGDNNGDKVLGDESTEPVYVGSLRKACFVSFVAYVRGAIAKLTSNPERGASISKKLESMTDQEIDWYFRTYEPRKKELSIVWSLMAFSAEVVESLIVVDRWLFLREHTSIVEDCWVEAVFDYKQSPRNLVVVGVKRSKT